MCMPCPADGCPDVKPCASTIEPMTNCSALMVAGGRKARARPRCRCGRSILSAFYTVLPPSTFLISLLFLLFCLLASLSHVPIHRTSPIFDTRRVRQRLVLRVGRHHRVVPQPWRARPVRPLQHGACVKAADGARVVTSRTCLSSFMLFCRHPCRMPLRRRIARRSPTATGSLASASSAPTAR